ncbi:Sigma-70 region 2 [Paenibacillus sp. yr247]|uniref:RNA polymerase sigma factor n=1 Tax=Paenibacillus sp. yr247 TaxID=1761880 RepID=UPI000882AD97|nr:sigma factor [Paenibacillus sp. yr247]SDN02268.1 Sigma-70 region 2 [Paenibacillus sp. yr247]
MESNCDIPDIIRQVKQGDQAAFDIVTTRYRLAAISWAQSIVRDAYLAEDVVQEAFIKMKEKIHDLQDDRKFAAVGNSCESNCDY